MKSFAILMMNDLFLRTESGEIMFLFGLICLIIISIILVIIIGLAIVQITIDILKYIGIKRKFVHACIQEKNIVVGNNKSIYDKECIEYSEQVLKYIREFISQIILLRFNSFSDSKQFDKVTEMNVKRLINDTCIFIKNSMTDKLNYDRLMYTPEFIDNYIIEYTIYSIKKLTNKTAEEF